MLPVRQQERVPGADRPPRGDAPRGHARDGAADEGLPRDRARGEGPPALRGQRRPLQLQRPRAPLLPAALAPVGRPAGEPLAEARPRRAEPRHRQARAPGPRRDREEAGRERQGGGDPARAAGHGHDGGRDLRPDAGGPPRGGEDRPRPLRDDGRGRGRPRLDGGRARPRPREPRPGEGRASRASRRWPRSRRWPARAPAATSPGSTPPPRASRCRCGSASRPPTGRAASAASRCASTRRWAARSRSASSPASSASPSRSPSCART